MSHAETVEFVFKPFGSESVDELLVTDPNPHCLYAIRRGTFGFWQKESTWGPYC